MEIEALKLFKSHQTVLALGPKLEQKKCDGDMLFFFPSGIWPIFGCFFQQRSILSHTETYHIKAEPLPWKVQTAVVLPLADS